MVHAESLLASAREDCVSASACEGEGRKTKAGALSSELSRMTVSCPDGLAGFDLFSSRSVRESRKHTCGTPTVRRRTGGTAALARPCHGGSRCASRSITSITPTAANTNATYYLYYCTVSTQWRGRPAMGWAASETTHLAAEAAAR